MLKVVSGFRAAGLWPFNPEMFTEVDSKPAQQKSLLFLQITEHEDQSAGVGLTSGPKTLN
jgi:hypothetical protein